MPAFLTRSGIFLLPALSSIAFYLTSLYEIPVTGFLFLLPLIAVLTANLNSFRRLLAANSVYTGVLYMVVLSWSPEVVQSYTGGNTLLTALCYIIFTLTALLISNMIMGLFYLAIRRISNKNSVFILLLLAVTLFLQEVAMAILLPGMPWLTLHLAYSVVHLDYVLQWASLGGVYFLSFCIAHFNMLLFIMYRMRRKTATIAIYVLLLGSGLGFGYSRLTGEAATLPGHTDSLRIAIVTENVPATVKWDAASVNNLVDTYFIMCGKALSTQPDLIVWTESAVPWTYSEDDDFLDSLITLSRPYGTAHIIGMNTQAGPESVYNSAYFIQNGKVSARQDKIHLLSFVEKPLFNFNLPFLQTDGFSAESGESLRLFTLKDTKIGTLICNESNVSQAAANMASEGAELLVNISNDSWFCNSELLINTHFKNARLRAVESGRPIIVNSNQGYSGHISGTGRILDQQRHTSAYTTTYTTHKKNYNTLYLSNKNSVISLLILYSIIIYILALTTQKSLHE